MVSRSLYLKSRRGVRGMTQRTSYLGRTTARVHRAAGSIRVACVFVAGSLWRADTRVQNALDAAHVRYHRVSLLQPRMVSWRQDTRTGPPCGITVMTPSIPSTSLSLSATGSARKLPSPGCARRPPVQKASISRTNLFYCLKAKNSKICIFCNRFLIIGSP